MLLHPLDVIVLCNTFCFLFSARGWRSLGLEFLSMTGLSKSLLASDGIRQVQPRLAVV